MEIHTFSVGPLSSNCYILDDGAGQGIIIDPGEDGDFLSSKILKLDLTLKYILLTHGHFDHVLGILPIKLNFNPIIMLSKEDLFLYKNASNSSQHWVGEGGDPLPSPDKFYTKEEVIRAGNTALEVLETPGHTPGSVVLYNEKEQIIFTGDLLFKDAVGRTDLSYSSTADLKNSLKKVKNKFSGYHAYPGHGQDFTI